MAFRNVEIILKFPLNEPNANGIIYTNDEMEKVVNNFNEQKSLIPLTTVKESDIDGLRRFDIGHITNMNIENDQLIVYASLRRTGFNAVATLDDNKNASKVSLRSIGICFNELNVIEFDMFELSPKYDNTLTKAGENNE